jgi:FtsZ-binding cell division protein ZapB
MEYRELKRLNLELSASNRNLTVQSSELNERNRVLEEQVNALQKYSDGALMAMVGDWIEVHNNTIDINEFSKTYGIVPSRVEQILDKMVSQRYLEIKE